MAAPNRALCWRHVTFRSLDPLVDSNQIVLLLPWDRRRFVDLQIVLALASHQSNGANFGLLPRRGSLRGENVQVGLEQRVPHHPPPELHLSMINNFQARGQ